MKICIVLMLIFLSSVFSFSQDTTKTNLENVEISARVVGLKLDTIILGIAYYPLSFVGMEANLVANSYGDRVVLGNIYLSRKINSNSQLLIPFATIGYGVFLSDESTLLYLGCGIKYKLKSNQNEIIQRAIEAVKYAKKYVDLAEDAIRRHEDAEWLLVPSIILAWSAIESFVNNRCSDLNSLPEDMFEMHERAFLLEKRLRFADSGANIGRFVLEGNEYQALENKIFFLLSKLGSRDATNLKGGTLWGRFEDFKGVRNSLVHPRRDEQEDLRSDDVRKYIETSQELIQEISKRIWKKTLSF